MAVTIQDLLEAGCHFGHQTKRWNPKMKDYVYGSKNGISIIDLTKTIRQIADACNFLQHSVMNGGKVLFIGTKRQAQQIVRECAESTEMNYVSERWMGGLLTNNDTIKKSIRKMREIDSVVNGEGAGLKKKEIALLNRHGEKLHKNLDGIANMRHLPDVVVVIDVCHDDIAIREARKLNIPIVGIVDTNGDPENIDYPIAANDDAVKSIKVITDVFVEAIKDASEIYGKKAAEIKAKEDAEKAERAKSKPADADKRRPARPAGKRPVNGDKKMAPKKKVEKPVEVKDLADLKKSDVVAKAE